MRARHRPTSTAASARFDGGLRERRKQPSRRDFLKTSALLGGGLVIGFVIPGARRFAMAQQRSRRGGASFAPNAFLRIGNDDSVTVLLAHSEMGQGIWTALPMLIAEELDADWSKIKVEHAPAAPAYAHTAVRHADDRRLDQHLVRIRPLPPGRRGGARDAGAGRGDALQRAGRRRSAPRTAWSSPATQRARYGELADDAGKLPAPDPTALTLKDPKDWKIIGKPTRRLDTPEKITGRAQFGMDVQFEGLLTARGRALAGVRRQGEIVRRHRGQGGARRAQRGAGAERRGGGRRSLLGGQARAAMR